MSKQFPPKSSLPAIWGGGSCRRRGVGLLRTALGAGSDGDQWSVDCQSHRIGRLAPLAKRSHRALPGLGVLDTISLRCAALQHRRRVYGSSIAEAPPSLVLDRLRCDRVAAAFPLLHRLDFVRSAVCAR